MREPKQEVGLEYLIIIDTEDEVINIDGYDYDSSDKETLTIGTDENVINLYYTKRRDLSYRVYYLEKDTNTILHGVKTVENKTFKEEVDPQTEIIDIDGYEFDSSDKETLIIEADLNSIILYYTKRTDLSYTVNYLEKDTNRVLHVAKTVENKTFEDEVSSETEIIDIEGYNYDSANVDILEIRTSGNVINLYYTKRTDLSYTVNYLDKDTNEVIHEPDTIENRTYQDIVVAADRVIEIDGYVYDSSDVDEIIIGVNASENVLTLYYTKRNDLRYTVNYLDKDTDETIHQRKIVYDQTFKTQITAISEKIDIDGYNYDSASVDILVIGTESNILNLYYTKRTDLSYTVNYLEKGTNDILHEPKTVENKTFKDEISAESEKIDIDGYNYDSENISTLTIGTSENILNLYYNKRTDLSYKVRYKELGTNRELHTEKVQQGVTFKTVINAASEIIQIDGYELVTTDKESIIVSTNVDENIITVFYSKRTDLSYTVNYLEKDTNEVLHEAKTVGNMTFETVINTEIEIITIEGYDFVSIDKESLIIGTGSNVINVYYKKKNNLSYTVNYLEKITNEVLFTVKSQGGMTYKSVIRAADEVIELTGYNYDSCDKDEITIEEDDTQNVINLYYTKRDDLSYTINYLEKDTGEVLSAQKVQENMTYQTKVKTEDEIIAITGYNYDSCDKDEIIIGVNSSENVINIYYTKVTGLSYTVNYLDKDTDESINPPKVEDNRTYRDLINSSDEVIEIDGYNYDSADKDSIRILTDVSENVINLYYTKRNDLSYKVNYLEKDTNEVLHEVKTVENVTFAAVINSTSEIIEIDGYKFDSADKENIIVSTNISENVITIYYTKRNDLKYTVKYLEKDTETELRTSKVQDEITFNTVINATDEIIEIDGYNYESSDKASENILNLYYTKKADLSYTVKYLEADTEREIKAAKVQNGVTYETIINAVDEVIDIDGYVFDSANKDSIQISTNVEENIINLYYKKRMDLSYKVNYLEKDTNEILHDVKEQNNVTFKSVIHSVDEVIEINGYNFDSMDKESLEIGTGTNEITIYYTKRNDLSYKIKYKELGTNVDIQPEKVQEGVTFKSVINSSDEVISIDGYEFVTADKDSLVISTNEDDNVITIFYSKRNDLSYTVNYLEKGTNEVLNGARTINNMTFNTVINSLDEVIGIDGYVFDSADKETLTIGTGENVIKLYYTKRNDLSYIVKYLEKDTDEVLHEAKTVRNKIFKDTIDSISEKIDINGYNYDSANIETLEIGTGENVIILYYTKRIDLSYTVNYLEKDTDRILHEPKIVENKTFGDVITSISEKIDINHFDYDSADKETLEVGTGENVINLYYTKRTDLSYTVNYLEKGTGRVIEDPKTVENKSYEDVVNSESEVINIDGYVFDSADKETLIIGTEENIINLYYAKRNDLTYKVRYINKDTNEEIHEEKDSSEITFEKVIHAVDEVIDIDGYEFNYADPEELTITTGENTMNLYYTRKAAKVIIYYYEEGTTNPVAESVIKNGFVNDHYETEEENIPDKYELVEEPINKEGTFTETDTEVIYYYRKKETKVIVHYYKEDTTEKISEDITITGKVDDRYETTQLESIDEKYELVTSKFPTNSEGFMTVDTINVIYYYRVKDTTITLKYIDMENGEAISEEKQMAVKVGDRYTSSEKDIEGYTYVEDSGNREGTLTLEPITVVFYYLKNTRVIVRHIDKNTNEVIEEEIKNGKVGDEYETNSKNIEEYVLVEEPENKTVTMTREDVIVNYYYAHVSSGVIEKHVDVKTGEIIENKVYSGNEGDRYETSPKPIEGYDIVESMIPENSTGTMEKETIEVIYYYIYKTKVIVKYIDEDSDRVLDTVEIEGHEGDNYETEQKTFDDYEIALVPENKNGEMTRETIEVEYVYKPILGEIVIIYVDRITGEEIEQKVIESGKPGETYDITGGLKEIEGYTIVEEPEDKTGTYTIEPQEKIYYYKRNSKVIVEYINIVTNEIMDKVILDGLEGDTYETEEREYQNTVLIEKPDNSDNTYKKDIVTKQYKYKKISKGVIERHIDEITNEVLYEEKHEGLEGDQYKISNKTFDGYDLDKNKLPKNSSGKLKEDEIVVTYYYKKKTTIRVKYIDKLSGEEISKDTIVNSHENETKKVTAKKIKGYTLLGDSTIKVKTEVTEDISGIIETETEVAFYYKKYVVVTLDGDNNKKKSDDKDDNKTITEDEDKGKSETSKKKSSGKAKTVKEVEETPAKTVKEKIEKVFINTGDNIIEYIIVFVVSGTIIVIATILRKKKDKK